MPDPAGRLRVIAAEGGHDGSGRLRSNRRRAVFRTQQAVHLPVRGSHGLSLGIFPLSFGDHALGVVEILAPSATIEGRMDVLLALVEQSALVLSTAGIRSEAERALAGMTALLRLASELLWARTAAEVVRLAVNASYRHLRTPIVGLLPDRDGWGWFLAASEGMGARRRSSLRASLRTSGDELGARRLRLPSLRARFRVVTGCREVAAVRAGAAILLLGDVPPGDVEFVDGIGSLVAGVLPGLGLHGVRPAADPSSELGIAWTAHELKGPLVGARAALDLATETARGTEGQDLLRRTKEELNQLSEFIDPLLRWSMGTQPLQRERADLVRVVHDAIASSSLGWDTDRVSLEGPDQLFVPVDERQLRSAIANVVRNALLYSPADTPVKVRVEADDRSARVVVRDRGPGVAPEDRAKVFHPFGRGRLGQDPRHPGSGLGLFIARRVLEAHGGSISLRPSRTGATFVLELPAERWQLSAS